MSDWKVAIHNDTDLSNYITANKSKFKDGDRLFTTYYVDHSGNGPTPASGTNADNAMGTLMFRNMTLYIEIVVTDEIPPYIVRRYGMKALNLGFKYYFLSLFSKIVLKGQLSLFYPEISAKNENGMYTASYYYITEVDASTITYAYTNADCMNVACPHIFNGQWHHIPKVTLGDWTSQVNTWDSLFKDFSQSYLTVGGIDDILTKYDWSAVRRFDSAFECCDIFDKIVFPDILYKGKVDDERGFDWCIEHMCGGAYSGFGSCVAQEILNVPVLPDYRSLSLPTELFNFEDVFFSKPSNGTIKKITFQAIDTRILPRTYFGGHLVNNSTHHTLDYCVSIKPAPNFTIDIKKMLQYCPLVNKKAWTGEDVWKSSVITFLQDSPTTLDFGGMENLVPTYQRNLSVTQYVPLIIKTSPKKPDNWQWNTYFRDKPTYLGPDSSYLFKRTDGAPNINVNNFVFMRG